jgi:CRISPR-associated protein Csd1
MILQALSEYYQRKSADPQTALAPYGFEEKLIPFLIVIDNDGKFLLFEDTREVQGKKAIARSFVAAQAIKKTSGVAANILWDPADYVLGVDTKGNPERTSKQVIAFRETIEKKLSAAINDDGLRAVLQFLNSLNTQSLGQDPHWNEIVETNPVLTFRLASDSGIVFNRPKVMSAYKESLEQSEGGGRACLVTGELDEISILHPSIKGVWGAQSSGSSLVSFNKDSFSSWGKSQGDNSPVGSAATFEYSTALNYLLRTNCPSRFQMGEVSVVCWAEKESDLESLIPNIFSDAPVDDPDANTTAVKNLINSVNNGSYQNPDGKQRFYVLGLSPNAARISVRFWQVGTVATFSEILGQWFKDLEIAGHQDKVTPPIKALLRSTALLGKDENMPPTLIGETIRAILTGLPLPASLLQSVLKRIKAEQGAVTYYRAALLKALLNRNFRYRNEINQEVRMALDTQELRIGYRLGRLFAVLEKLQEDANPGLNSTIRDRYYSSASCTPKSVFGTLMRLHTHHLKKMQEQSWRVAAENNISAIISGITDFPSHLSLEDQGLFAIGYYHQRQERFTKKISPQGEVA